MLSNLRIPPKTSDSANAMMLLSNRAPKYDVEKFYVCIWCRGSGINVGPCRTGQRYGHPKLSIGAPRFWRAR